LFLVSLDTCGLCSRGLHRLTMAIGSYDATVRLWDTKSQSHKPLMTLTEAKDSISSLSVVGHEITAGSIDGKVRTYDIRMGQVYVDVIGCMCLLLLQLANKGES
jgi:WD40 repeat protein